MLSPHAQALKMLLAVVRHFGDFAEDQFDFHSYCVRKMTLRAYVAMLRMQDELRGNAFFAKVGPLPPGSRWPPNIQRHSPLSTLT